MCAQNKVCVGGYKSCTEGQGMKVGRVRAPLAWQALEGCLQKQNMWEEAVAIQESRQMAEEFGRPSDRMW